MRSTWPDRVSGLLGALASLAVAELAAGVVASVPSLIEAVGALVITLVPPPVKDLAIGLFGTHDKVALLVGIVVVSGALGLGIGPLTRRHPGRGAAVFGAFAALGAYAAVRRPGVGHVLPVTVAVLSAAVGFGVLRWLQRLADRGDEVDAGRRAFLAGAGAVVTLGVLSAAVGRLLIDQAKRVAARREDVALPVPASPASPLTSGDALAIPGLSPLVTPNADFYRIDTALSPPRVDLADWSLRLTGMVTKEVELGFQDLLDLPLEERYVTISCVSNQVGGDLVGNARWLGVPLRQVLSIAGVAHGAQQIVGRSVDGFTVGFPVDAAFDGRHALVAVGMNGEPLPFEHGFPARLVVAGLYGYVSATKWLSEIELTTWDGFDAYWVPRGWAKQAPVKTESRIDVPHRGSRLPAGPRSVAGVAWAPDRGISKVELQIDDGPWVAAELSAALSKDAWRQWMVRWDATPGNHTLRVRATDGTGRVQDEAIRPPAPDGATGYHTIAVAVV